MTISWRLQTEFQEWERSALTHEIWAGIRMPLLSAPVLCLKQCPDAYTLLHHIAELNKLRWRDAAQQRFTEESKGAVPTHLMINLQVFGLTRKVLCDCDSCSPIYDRFARIIT